MPALTFAVVLVGALCALNLLLTFGVIRRMREDTWSRSRPAAAELSASIAPVGTAVRGTALGWDGETLVGFFMPGCGPCEQELPDFIKYARTRERAVAVVLDPAGEAADLVRTLGQVAQVVVEDGVDGALQNAFEVKGFPVFCMVRDGVISSTAHRAPALAAQAVRLPA